jgi:short-subunit dehydrogenase
MTTSLITGATAGIGAAFARRLAGDGHSLVLVARDQKRLEDYSADLRGTYQVPVEWLAADLSQDDGIAAVEARLGDRERPVDVLVNNAGFGILDGFLEAPMTDEVKLLKLHCETVLRLTGAAAAAMRDRGRGWVINVASVAAFLPRGTYGASKAWVVSFTQGVAQELAGSGVRLMALCPGFVRTEFHERAGMDASVIPDWLWLDADKVVAAAVRDLARGKTLSVPDPRYKAVAVAARLAPRSAYGRFSMKGAARR